MSEAQLHLLEHYDGPSQLDVGTGADVTTAAAELIGRTGIIAHLAVEPAGVRPLRLADRGDRAVAAPTNGLRPAWNAEVTPASRSAPTAR